MKHILKSTPSILIFLITIICTITYISFSHIPEGLFIIPIYVFLLLYPISELSNIIRKYNKCDYLLNIDGKIWYVIPDKYESDISIPNNSDIVHINKYGRDKAVIIDFIIQHNMMVDVNKNVIKERKKLKKKIDIIKTK